jgi:osmotically inducible protein OsmC
MPVRKANAEWHGDLKNGAGTLSTETGTLKDVPYNAVSRFEQGDLTNPEELLGAAHAGCFSMALANSLSKEGFKVNSIKTEDKVSIARLETGFKITKIEVSTVADVNDIDEKKFLEFAEKSKTGCPVSQALTGTEIVLTAKLKK